MACVVQLRQNDAENAFPVTQYLRIPKSQHLISLRRERGIAGAVFWIICMLPAIDLNDELLLATNKIDDIGADGFLPNEFESIQASVAQGEP
jgi:hypothetical protein